MKCMGILAQGQFFRNEVEKLFVEKVVIWHRFKLSHYKIVPVPLARCSVWVLKSPLSFVHAFWKWWDENSILLLQLNREWLELKSMYLFGVNHSAVCFSFILKGRFVCPLKAYLNRRGSPWHFYFANAADACLTSYCWCIAKGHLG